MAAIRIHIATLGFCFFDGSALHSDVEVGQWLDGSSTTRERELAFDLCFYMRFLSCHGLSHDTDIHDIAIPPGRKPRKKYIFLTLAHSEKKKNLREASRRSRNPDTRTLSGYTSFIRQMADVSGQPGVFSITSSHDSQLVNMKTGIHH